MTYTPLSTNTYLTTSPNETNFTVTWNSPYYLETEDVYAKVNGATWTVVSVSGTTVVLATGIPANANVFIYRDTDISENVANFSAGSTFRAQDLNKNYDQLLFKVQENQDIANKAQGDIDIIDNTLSGIALYVGLANTAALNTAAANLIANPSSTSIRYEVSDSTNIDGSVVTPPTTNPAPLPVINSLPSGVNWNAGIATRVIWNGSSWDFNVYIPYDPDGRYLENGEVNLATTTSSTTNIITNTAGTDATLVGASGTDAGLLSSADKTKLDGIETAATADQTGAEIKALYEVEANAFTDTQFTKLAGIETGATTDQTGAEIKTLYESQADTNAFTDADHTKLDGISSGATVSQWSDVTGGINYASGNVGIGTSSPSSLLHLAANAPYITFEDVDNNQDWQLQATAWFALRNQTTSSELLRVNANGNVGIGTNSPGKLLHISSGDPQMRFTDTTTGANFDINANSSAGNVSLNVDSTVASSQSSLIINTRGSEKLRVQGTTGNVGIGTSSPHKKLDVITDGTNGDHTTFRQIRLGDDVNINYSGFIGFANTGDKWATFIESVDNGSASNVVLAPSGGNVGIGTSDPSACLQVATNGAAGVPTLFLSRAPGVGETSDIALRSNAVIRSENSIRSVINTGGHFSWWIGGNNSKLGTSGAAEVVRINSAGSVGIGTSNPSAKLAVSDSGNNGIEISPTFNSGQSILTSYNRGTSSYTDITFSANQHIFSEGNTERMRIDSTGKVGIGTTSPNSKLTVNGAINAANLTISSTTKLALNVNDGHGNTNIVFNDISGFAQQNGSCARITSATDGTTGTLVFQVGNNSVSGTTNTKTSVLTLNTSGASITGSLSKSSGSFKIDHPLPALSETHDLVHSFVEAPDASNLYAGMVELVDGTATVNIDTAHRMTEGTFEALNTLQSWSSSNESGYAPVKCSVSGNLLTIECQDATSTDTVYYEVRGVRKDPHMFATEWTDANGLVIVEPKKIVESEE